MYINLLSYWQGSLSNVAVNSAFFFYLTYFVRVKQETQQLVLLKQQCTDVV